MWFEGYTGTVGVIGCRDDVGCIGVLPGRAVGWVGWDGLFGVDLGEGVGLAGVEAVGDEGLGVDGFGLGCFLEGFVEVEFFVFR